FKPLRELTELYHEGMIAVSASQSIFALMDAPTEINEPEKAASEKLNLAPEISFEGIGFGYSEGRGLALDDVSFTLRAGEKLGLVGSSGAGKSTVVWLIYRFFDPQQGRILLGGHDLRNLSLDILRGQIAVVTQDTYLFQGTVRDNLRFGKPEATQEELEGATRAANAHDFIMQLPQGYDTVVGERAVRLSGGQRQRIAIARALLKDSPILVLDEALSSVDAENEAVIQEALDRLMEGRTTLIIAHRLSSVVGADRILVLNKGRLVESGAHGELVAAGGVYAGLMANQQAEGDQGMIRDTVPATEGDGRTAAVAADEMATSMVGDDQREEVAAPISGSTLGTWTVVRRLFGLIRPWRVQQTITFLLGIAHHGSVIGLGVVSALTVGQVFRGGDLTVYLVLLATFAPLAAFFQWAESWLAHDLAYKLLAEMRIDMYRKLDPLAPAYLVTRKSGDIVSIVNADIEKIEYFFGHAISPSFVAIVVPAAVLITLGVISWPLAVVLLPFLLAVGIRPFYDQKRAERLGSEFRSKLGDVHSHMVDNIQGMREIAAFGRGPTRIREIDAQGWDYAHSHLEFVKAQASQAGFIESMTGLGGLAVLAAGAYLVLEGNMARPDLPLAAILALSTFSPVSDIARTVKDVMETLAASRRVFAVHDEPVPVRDGRGVSTEAGATPPIQFEGVVFAYGSGQPQALKGVSFSVEPGNTVALVGRSGAGKTTCAYLLMRFWDPQSGRILLGGHDLRDFDLDHLRRQIAFVSQDTYLFNASIRENIRLGKVNATDEEVEEAARQANALEFIESFPEINGVPEARVAA
ncbi:MAG: ABC transporter ATP-binding protein, partial [Dehalococcoidia bacterium]